MAEKRTNETDHQKRERCQKNKDHMRKIREEKKGITRIKKFQDSVRYGPIFICTVCEQDMFINNVSIITKDLENKIKEFSCELFQATLDKKIFVGLNDDFNAYICRTCKKHLMHEKLPPMAAANGLKVIPLDDIDLRLTEVENNLIAKRIMFQKIYQLPKSRMAACKDHLINIPITTEKVLNTLQQLPRTPEEAGLLEVKLKRKLDYKNTHKQAFIDTKRIYKALNFLKSMGHPEYQVFDDMSLLNG